MSNTITHGACGKTWTGAGRAHCSGEAFSTYGASDKHRVGEFGRDRRCAHPSTGGLVEREGGIWGYPSPDPTSREFAWHD